MILLASRSPQRRALLGALGVEFRVVVSRVDEGADPAANARAKAEDVAARVGPPGGGDAVIGADTEVLLDGRALGKAADRRCQEIIKSFSHTGWTSALAAFGVTYRIAGENIAAGR